MMNNIDFDKSCKQQQTIQNVLISEACDLKSVDVSHPLYGGPEYTYRTVFGKRTDTQIKITFEDHSNKKFLVWLPPILVEKKEPDIKFLFFILREGRVYDEIDRDNTIKNIIAFLNDRKNHPVYDTNNNIISN